MTCRSYAIATSSTARRKFAERRNREKDKTLIVHWKWIKFDLDQEQANRMSYYHHLVLHKSPHKLQGDASMRPGRLHVVIDEVEFAATFMTGDYGWDL
jgi:hypothetical protein